MERACILATGSRLTREALFEELSPAPGISPADPDSLSQYLEQCERGYIARCLERNRWQMAQTAGDLGISRKNLWEKMRKLDLRQPAPQ